MLFAFRILCFLYTLYSLSFYPILELDYKFANAGYRIIGVTQEAKISEELKKEIVLLANDAQLQTDTQIAQKYEIQKVLSISGALFGIVCFMLSFRLQKHNKGN